MKDCSVNLANFDRTYLDPNTPCLVGVDEAGRGALAGPVVAAAAVLGAEFYDSEWVAAYGPRIDDSKNLKPAVRSQLKAMIDSLTTEGMIRVGVGIGSVEEIADHNILGATRRAMARALEMALSSADCPYVLPMQDSLFAISDKPVARVLIDGLPLRGFPYVHEGVVKGDAQSLCIAMASIVAKVTRDALMVELAQAHSAYGFEVHKGYGTPTHREALRTHGPAACHRELFLRKIL